MIPKLNTLPGLAGSCTSAKAGSPCSTQVTRPPRQPPYLAKDLGHLKGAHRVHVGSNDGDPCVRLLGVAEYEGPHEIHLGGRETRIKGIRLQERYGLGVTAPNF